jgi:hypothetical protein
LPNDKCTKTEDCVIDVLKGKHPDLRVPELGHEDNLTFETYDTCPDPVPLVCDPVEVEKVAAQLGGAAGVDSIDAVHMHAYLSTYGRSLAELREELAEWGEWMANTSPPWAAYRGLLTRRLVALDKSPGTRPVGIGCIWMRAIAKLLLLKTAKEAKEACNALQLCAGLEAGIEGGMHSVLATATEMGGMTFQDGELDPDQVNNTRGTAPEGETGGDGVDAAMDALPITQEDADGGDEGVGGASTAEEPNGDGEDAPALGTQDQEVAAAAEAALTAVEGVSALDAELSDGSEDATSD